LPDPTGQGSRNAALFKSEREKIALLEKMLGEKKKK